MVIILSNGYQSVFIAKNRSKKHSREARLMTISRKYLSSLNSSSLILSVPLKSKFLITASLKFVVRRTLSFKVIIYEILMDFAGCIKGRSIDVRRQTWLLLLFYLWFSHLLLLFFSFPNFHVWRDYKLMAAYMGFCSPLPQIYGVAIHYFSNPFAF